MTRGKYTLLAGAFLVFYLGALVTDLDLGGFGVGLLIIAAVFGLMAGYGLAYGMVAQFSTDIYQIPVVFSPFALGVSMLAVLVASIASGWLVKRDLDRVDLVLALKTRE